MCTGVSISIQPFTFDSVCAKRPQTVFNFRLMFPIYFWPFSLVVFLGQQELWALMIFVCHAHHSTVPQWSLLQTNKQNNNSKTIFTLTPDLKKKSNSCFLCVRKQCSLKSWERDNPSACGKIVCLWLVLIYFKMCFLTHHIYKVWREITCMWL